MEWISVEDRLPEEHQSILVYYYLNKKSKHFPLRRYMTESAFYNGEFENNDVTHWMPLLKLPKEEQEGTE